jgi:hypothetical protein
VVAEVTGGDLGAVALPPVALAVRWAAPAPVDDPATAGGRAVSPAPARAALQACRAVLQPAVPAAD